MSRSQGCFAFLQPSSLPSPKTAPSQTHHAVGYTIQQIHHEPEYDGWERLYGFEDAVDGDLLGRLFPRHSVAGVGVVEEPLFRLVKVVLPGLEGLVTSVDRG